MKNEFDIFNNMKIDEDEFDEINLSNEEKDNLKKRMKVKVNNKKKVNYKKRIAVAGVPLLIAGSIAMTSETTWAYIEQIGKQIEVLLGREKEDFNEYKVNIDQTIEQDGLKFKLSELMLDDGQIILSMNMDYSDFKYKESVTNIETLRPEISNVKINDLVYAGSASSTNSETVKGENQINYLLKWDLTEIDTDGDGGGDKSYEILDNIEKNKNYSISINFDGVTYESKESNSNIIGTHVSEDGKEIFYNNRYLLKLSFNVTVNGTNIMENTIVKK